MICLACAYLASSDYDCQSLPSELSSFIFDEHVQVYATSEIKGESLTMSAQLVKLGKAELAARRCSQQ